jgi:hypothetical protein
MNGTGTKSGPKKRWLYGPILGVALLAGLYTAYWFFAIGKIEQGLDDWIDQQRAEGVELDYASREFGGFPYRFMVTFDTPRYGNWQANWTGERLELFMQPWNYRHAIARAPGRNEVRAQGFEGTALLDEDSAASFRWNADGLTNIGVTLNVAELVSDQADISVRGLKTNYAVDGDTARLGVDWDAISLSPELLTGQDLSYLGPELQTSRLRIQTTGLVDRASASETQARAVNLAQLRLNWGPLKLGAKGDFEITPAGQLDGPLQIRLDEANALSDAMKAAGNLPAQTALIVQAIGAASQDGQFLTLPIVDGAVSVLGFPVAKLQPVAPPLLEPRTNTPTR